MRLSDFDMHPEEQIYLDDKAFSPASIKGFLRSKEEPIKEVKPEKPTPMKQIGAPKDKL